MTLNTNILLSAYMQGVFPMANSRTGIIYWHSPAKRAIFRLSDIHVPRSIRQLFKKQLYSFTIDEEFETVVRNCANRKDTWINDEIICEYSRLNKLGYAHSIEAWKGDQLVGGLYGVHIGGAYFGESMYAIESNVTKLCFYVLCQILIQNGFILLDSQYLNDFTESLGAIEIPKDQYHTILKEAISLDCSFIQ